MGRSGRVRPIFGPPEARSMGRASLPSRKRKAAGCPPQKDGTQPTQIGPPGAHGPFSTSAQHFFPDADRGLRPAASVPRPAGLPAVALIASFPSKMQFAAFSATSAPPRGGRGGGARSAKPSKLLHDEFSAILVDCGTTTA